jgi:hypothetical protein
MTEQELVGYLTPMMNGDDESVVRALVEHLPGNLDNARMFMAELFCRGVSKEDAMKYIANTSVSLKA